MAYITFYEKPGCINNEKQKAWLKAAGHKVDSVNILNHSWSKEALKQFFGSAPISECFNRTAPAIKSGDIYPDSLAPDEALDKMIAMPILIKRPLIIIDQTLFLQGFDANRIHSLIGLDPTDGYEDIVHALKQTDMTTCPKLLADEPSCDDSASNLPVLPELSPIKNIVEQMGLEITYMFEDLVFVEHNAFLFQFIHARTLNLFFNQLCPEEDVIHIERQIHSLAEENELIILTKGKFSITEKEDETLDIHFINTTD